MDIVSEHIVGKGECITSIADANGHFWQTIWNHSANTDLRRQRSNPHTLSPGDRLVIPDLRQRIVPVPTGTRHRFRRKGIPTRFTLQLFRSGAPRANQPWTLTGGDFKASGTTDAKGILTTSIPTTLLEATLTVGPDDFRLPIRFGALPPIEAPDGIRARLANLGFCRDPQDPSLEAALRLFQSFAGLPITGAPDAATLQKLVEIHDLSRPESIAPPSLWPTPFPSTSSGRTPRARN